MRDTTLRLLLAAVLVLLQPFAAHAAGLGRLTLFSTLGQALNAEVELLAVQKNETITARFAPPEVYRDAGVQYNNALTGGRVTVERRPNGQLYLKATTPRPVTEPFVELLIEINSESGRIVRQYTALLDPPGYGRAAGELPPPVAAPAVRPPVAGIPEAPPVATPAPPPPPVAAAPAPPPAPRARAAAPAPTPAPAARQYGPIRPGETPGAIARAVRPEGVSVEQTLLGLYRHNPDAFIDKNINLVKSGRILRVPEAEALAAVPHRQAVQEVRLQVANFDTYSRRVAERAAAAPEEGRAASGRIAARVAEQTGEAPPRDTVRVSRGEPAAKPKAAVKGSTEDRVRTLEEEALAREKALADANARIAQLEQIIKDSQRAVELKGAAPAVAQKGADRAADKAAVPAPAPGAVAVAPPPVAAAPPTPERSTAADASLPAVPAPDGPKGAGAAADPAAAKPDSVPVAKAKPAPAPAPAEPGFMDTLTSEPLYLAAAVAAVLLLGALALMIARRRRRDTGEVATNDSPVRIPPSLGTARTAGALPAAAAAGAATATTAASEPARVAPPPEPPRAEESASPWPPMSPASPSMPASGPLGDDDLDFHRTAAQRAATAPVSERAAAPGPFPSDFEAFEVPEPGPASRAAAPSVPYAARPGQTSEDSITRPRHGEAPALEPLMPDFALETPPPDMALRDEKRTAPPGVPEATEFDLEPLPPIEAPLDAEKVSSEPPDLDFKLDLADFDIAAPGRGAEGAARDDHWYDVQQKFDLAKAYEEMGDKDGARDILQEVLSEGDTQQQEQAKKLLSALT